MMQPTFALGLVCLLSCSVPVLAQSEEIAPSRVTSAPRASALPQAPAPAIKAPLMRLAVEVPDTEREDLPEPPDTRPSPKPNEQDGLPVTAKYSKQGFQVRTLDNRFLLAIQNRIQIRYANPFDSDPRSLSDLRRNQNSFMIRRARTRLTGHAYWSWLKYAMQYDWRDPILRDINLSVEKFAAFKLWAGRGKVLYNDERLTSSGRQQFVNRSIINDIFTVDRQEGLQFSGHLFPGTWHDFNYSAGIFSGLGVGERQNDDAHLMYSGRLQWNVLGRSIAFSQSDVIRHLEPTLNVAVAGATNQSRCTAFATAAQSCASLPGFTAGEAGQYRLNQLMEEVRFRWQGLSLNHELHWKQVIDTLKPQSDAARATDMVGGLVQVGYFPHGLLPVIPPQLEVAGRYAWVDPNLTSAHDTQQEISGVINYFLNGHENKLSLQLSQLLVADPRLLGSQGAQRLWLQWDLTF